MSNKAKTQFEMLFMDRGRLTSNITIVRGPSGCGKDTMIRYFARKYGYEIVMDREVENELEVAKLVATEDYHQDRFDPFEEKRAEGITYVKVFCDVMERAVFETASKKKRLYYMRDIPNMNNEKERLMVWHLFQRIKAVGLYIVPIIFCLNSNICDEYSINQVWPKDFHSKLLFIDSVQSNATSIERALIEVVEHNKRKGHTISMTPNQLKELSRMANCDMNVALNLLRMNPKCRNKVVANDELGKDLQDSNLFHMFGKIMYNKSRRF